MIKNNKILIVLLLVIIVLLGLIAFKPKSSIAPSSNPEIMSIDTNGMQNQENGDTHAAPIQSTSPVSFALPSPYINSQNWPPSVETSTALYSCSPRPDPQDGINGATSVKVIHGKAYCVTTFSDAGAGQRYGTYTYTTGNEKGTKTLRFKLSWPNCGVGYEGAQYDQCEAAQSNFFDHLDEMVDSIISQ